MTVRGSTLGFLGLAALGVLGWWLAREVPTDEQRILAMLDEMRAAALDKDPSGILTHLAEGYQDDSGMSRRELRAYLFGFFLGAQSIGVTVLRRHVVLQGAAATADLRLLLFRNGQSDGLRILLRLARAGDEWQVQSSFHELLGSP